MKHFAAIIGLLLASASWAAETAPVPASAPAVATFSPEMLRFQSFLEDLLVRRYSQDLSTLVDRGAFSLGAKVQLVDSSSDRNSIISESLADQEIPPDLFMGTLDPEEALKTASAEGNFKIRSIVISVGLKEDIPTEAKAQVETWLTERLTSEFGQAGKASVSYIKTVPESKPAPVPHGILDVLNQFQNLTGQIILALSILLCAVLWKILGGAGANAAAGARESGGSQSINVSMPQGQASTEPEKKKSSGEPTALEAVSSAVINEYEQMIRQLTALVPRLSSEFDEVMRKWCQAGEDGRLKLACFVEAVGDKMGKIAIPVDAIPDMSKTFAKMPQVGMDAKRDVLRKVYWDLVMAVNLGQDSLDQPFNYLGNLSTGMVNQILMDQNPKMKALVALHMPNELRESYLRSLTVDVKRELIQTAAEMTEIAADDLKSMDGAFKSRLTPETKKGVVLLGATLNKFVSVLSPIEEITLLSQVKGRAIEEFKRSTPSLAFLGEWPDQKLGLLFSRAMPDEVVAFLRVRPDLKEKVLPLCPSMTAEVAADDLSKKDTMNEKQKNTCLQALFMHLSRMLKAREASLEEIFVQEQGNEVQKAA